MSFVKWTIEQEWVFCFSPWPGLWWKKEIDKSIAVSILKYAFSSFQNKLKFSLKVLPQFETKVSLKWLLDVTKTCSLNVITPGGGRLIGRKIGLHVFLAIEYKYVQGLKTSTRVSFIFKERHNWWVKKCYIVVCLRNLQGIAWSGKYPSGFSSVNKCILSDVMFGDKAMHWSVYFPYQKRNELLVTTAVV